MNKVVAGIMYKYFGILPLFLLLLNCGEKELIDGRYYADEYRGEPILVGQITAAEIWQNIPSWREAYRDRGIDSALTGELQKIDAPVKIVIVLGIWCPDSENGVPQFMKQLDVAANPRISLEMHGVNRKMESPRDIAERFGVERVPTFIILKNEREIGRMIEFPKKSFGADLIEILSSDNSPQ